MKVLIIALIAISIVIIGIVISLDFFKTKTDAVIQLSVTTQTSPNDIKIHTQQQLSDMNSGVTVLDDSALDKIPVLKNAIDQALSKFTPPPLHGEHTFSTQISQEESDSIMQLAGNKVNQLPVTQINDMNFGVNFTSYTSIMEFKFNNFYYHVVIEQLVPIPVTQPVNSP